MQETNEKSKIIHNLNYIGLDLENIPAFLKKYKDVDYKPTRAYEQTDFKVYKYINIKDIQILFTPKNRLDSLSEKYLNAVPIKDFLDSKNEENYFNHAKFLKMVETLNEKEINIIEMEQKQANKSVPFKVKYNTNYLWEIYYSEYTNKYFMMLTTEDSNYNAFFYLLKKQIEAYKNNSEQYVYVPITYMDYTNIFMKKSEILDLEKYLWLFTKHWCNVYEVFDCNNNIKMYVVGKTNVYEGVESYYSIELKDKEDCMKFFNLVKALFILKTELPTHYNFETQIDNNGKLIFENCNKIIDYDKLAKFIKDEYLKKSVELKGAFERKLELDLKLNKLKEEELEKNKEYLFREKQVATFLECKKTLFGKLKYYLKTNNGKFIKQKNKDLKDNKIQENNKMERDIALEIIENKEFYTIEDLIKICIEYDRFNNKIKQNNLDIIAIQDKVNVLDKKIKNSELFIKKIEEHKKSIFEFWRFANKDLPLALNSSKIEESIQKNNKLKKTFNYIDDIEELGIQADKIQREILTKEECDAIFLTTTKEIECINNFRKDELINEKIINNLKEENNNREEVYSFNSFDIFGNIKNDKTKISVLSNKRHRESKKDKFKILDISNNLEINEYIKKISNVSELVNTSLNKMKALIDFDVYAVGTEKLNMENLKIFYINPIDAIKQIKDTNRINLYKIKIKEGMNLIYNTNIIYFDNINNTLPIGMDVDKTILIDLSKYKLDVKKQTIFRIHQDDSNFLFNEKIVCSYEYNIT